MSNLPDGVRDTDLPGYNDSEETREVYCAVCDTEVEVEGVYTSNNLSHRQIVRGASPGTFYFTCPVCETEGEDEVAGLDFDEWDY